ncbi:DUF695 domain-containing protein [Pedobacter caeni]|uniref:DUF695 domain-containing protein n=1 Tax=Pedobacter caeni TaxID=288992 RepID=A0A1M5NCY6_9SPHI|nr:DUF695 domain-containing protein [Pedobacter caeni]SHG87434.1 hypothetical protein SAMN04488522_10893 [Pedobacter caeni]
MMTWEEVKMDTQKVYPKSSITVFLMDTEQGKPATHWVDKAYKDYSYKRFCPFNCLVSIDLSDRFNVSKANIDTVEIENYFKEELRKVCVCHLLARVTTDNGFDLELYLDDVEEALKKFRTLENDPDRLLNFNCEITEDNDWENIEGLLR